jgi:hypothetical protein
MDSSAPEDPEERCGRSRSARAGSSPTRWPASTTRSSRAAAWTFDEVREYVCRRRGADDRLERHRAHGTAVRQEIHRGARADHPAAGRRERLGQLRLDRRRASASWRRNWPACWRFSAIRNNDKVGLILFTDQIEQYIPPKKGRRHVLRVVREITAPRCAAR